MQAAMHHLHAAPAFPSAKEIGAYADTCFAEAMNQLPKTFSVGAKGSFDAAETGPLLRLEQLSGVQGVNALRHDASLSFADAEMTVIYGANGAGKTGFSRLLKEVCGAKVKHTLHSNVFSDDKTTIRAEISYALDGALTPHNWTLTEGPVDPLRHAHVFDVLVAGSYVNTKREATYEPRRLRLLSTLIDVCDEVVRELQKRKSALVSALPTMPPAYIATPAHIFLSRLNTGPKQAIIDAACSYSAEENAERISTESALQQGNIDNRLKEIARLKIQLTALKDTVAQLKQSYSDEQLTGLRDKRVDAVASRKAATENAEKVFAGAALPEVGSDTWRRMWEEARAYSTHGAYPGMTFPAIHDGSACVLCQQPLDEAAKERLKSFESFIKGGLEAKAVKAASELTQLEKGFLAIPTLQDWSLRLVAAEVETGNDSTIHAALAARAALVVPGITISALPLLDWSEIDASLEKRSAAVVAEESSLNALKTEGGRAQKEKRLAELRAKEWLSQNKTAIEAEVKRLASISQLATAEALARTHALTGKKNELASKELAEAHQSRFTEELAKLGGGTIPVVPASLNEGKGKVSFHLALKGAKKRAPVPEVLSEGEMRIVAMAAFLADILASGRSTPFIFDDPISSLDHRFEARVAERLAELAQSRQVIVFTHRLSLLAALEEARETLENLAKKEGKLFKLRVVTHQVLRTGGLSGNIGSLPPRQSKPKQGLARIRDHEMPAISKALKAGDMDQYDKNLKAACSDFRILVESVVEYVLLDNIVGRYRLDIKTKGKLARLTKILQSDVDLIDDLMTRYSTTEHKAPDETPMELPEPTVLAKDVDTLLMWLAEFEKR